MFMKETFSLFLLYCFLFIHLFIDVGQQNQTLSSEIRSLAERAKANKLLPHEFQGGSFTISNLGMFGISSFKAVINPPQTAILAIGGSVARVVPAEDGSIQAANFVSYTLSYDVRAIEPEDAAQFLDDLDRIIENPRMGLL